MTKYKFNPAVASLAVIASLFAGWQTTLIVVALIIVFGELDGNTKNIIVRVLSFLLVLTLFSYFWDFIVLLWGYVETIIDGLIGFINSYLPFDKQIDLAKFSLYFLVPINYLVGIADEGVNIIVLGAKIFFAVSLLFGKPIKQNVISTKIGNAMNKIINFVNNFGAAPQQANPAPQQPAPSAPVPPQNNQTV